MPTRSQCTAARTLASRQLANSGGLTRVINLSAISSERLAIFLGGDMWPLSEPSTVVAASSPTFRINAIIYALYAYISGEVANLVDSSRPSHWPVDVAARSFPSSRLLRGVRKSRPDRLNYRLTRCHQDQVLLSKYCPPAL